MAELITKFATETPNAAALIDEVGTTTWAEFNDRVNRLVNGLRAIGVVPGSTIAAMMANTREYYEVLAAAAHGGFACVPVNWHWVADELSYVLNDAEATVFIADARFADVARIASMSSIASTGSSSLVQRIAVGGKIEGFADYEAFVAGSDATEPDNQVLGGPMFYTSGTTGRPKGVRGSLMGNSSIPSSVFGLLAAGFAQSAVLPAASVTLLDGPLYHSAQWAFSMFPLMAGATIVMRHKFDPVETLRAIDEYGVTNVHLVPTQFIRLLKLPEATRASFRGDSLKMVWHGAAPCPPEVKRAVIEWWGPKITEYYGGTEGGIVSMATSQEWLAKPGTLGKAQPTMEIRIVKDDGTVAGVGESGTIYSKNLMGSDFTYHNDPEKTARAHLEPGLITLGDIGYLDADGDLFMSDRKIDMIISGGVNIYPAEIEGVLVTHPAVRDAAVFGIPNDEFGEEVKAAIELGDGYEPSDALKAEILAFVRTLLAGYKVPRSIDIEVALPRQPTGKLYKRLLRDRYWEGVGRSI
jgi:long-chain acyl-CoA synthetase